MHLLTVERTVCRRHVAESLLRNEKNLTREIALDTRRALAYVWTVKLAGAVFLVPLFVGCYPSDLVQGWNLIRTLDLKWPTHHVQGIDFDARTIWVTSVDSERRKGYLQTFSIDSGRMLETVELQDGDRFHPGGISAGEGSLWIPVAEYRSHSSSVIQKRDQKTLQITFQFPVDDHIGCVAVTPEYLIGGNWDSREFYIWDHAGKMVRKIPNKTDNAYQDLKFDSSYLVASGMLTGHTGAIDWLILPSLDLSRRVRAGYTDQQMPLTREGMAIHQDQLLLLPEDEPSRVFFFRRSR